jgi:hypothetical protein
LFQVADTPVAPPPVDVLYFGGDPNPVVMQILAGVAVFIAIAYIGWYFWDYATEK